MKLPLVDWQNMKLNSCDDGWTHFSCKIISWLQLLRCEDLLLFLWMIWIMWMCFNNVELWTVGWTQQALWRCHFGLWLIVTPFLTIFTIVTKQTINGSMEKIISRWIQNENNHQLQSDTKQFKMSKLNLCPDEGTRWKVIRSPKSVGFILWRSWLSEQ